MADPYRLIVLKRLTALIETMSVADGYPYDLVGRVHRGRTIYGEETNMPFISIIEAPRPGFNNYAGVDEATATTWDLLLQGYCEDDMKHPSDPLYVFAEAVENVMSKAVLMLGDGSGRAAFPEWYLLGRDEEETTWVHSFQFGPSVVRAPDGTPMTKACFYLPVKLGIAREVGQRVNAA